ncbi:YihY/virulence factor BrkB family protein [candidate division WOR-3 bacterium]|nr:YihY/virulence factor BrkB family protein [candidate division WOR-3 bacterium]
MNPRKRRKREFLTLIRREISDISEKYNRRNGSLLAKGLGFSFLFGLIPLLFFATSIGGYLYRLIPESEIKASEFYKLLSFIPQIPRERFLSHIQLTSDNWGALGFIGIVFLIVVAVGLFDSLERAFATMLSAPRRKFHTGRLISLALMVGVVLFFFCSALFSTAAHYLYKVIALPKLSIGLIFWGGKFLSFIIFAFVLLGLYYLFARRRLRFWRTLGIAFVASGVWEIISLLGSFFIRYAGHRVIIYGALAWVTILLIYMRLLAELLLVSSLFVSRASPPEETA